MSAQLVVTPPAPRELRIFLELSSGSEKFRRHQIKERGLGWVNVSLTADQVAEFLGNHPVAVHFEGEGRPSVEGFHGGAFEGSHSSPFSEEGSEFSEESEIVDRLRAGLTNWTTTLTKSIHSVELSDMEMRLLSFEAEKGKYSGLRRHVRELFPPEERTVLQFEIHPDGERWRPLFEGPIPGAAIEVLQTQMGVGGNPRRVALEVIQRRRFEIPRFVLQVTEHLTGGADGGGGARTRPADGGLAAECTISLQGGEDDRPLLSLRLPHWLLRAIIDTNEFGAGFQVGCDAFLQGRIGRGAKAFVKAVGEAPSKEDLAHDSDLLKALVGA